MEKKSIFISRSSEILAIFRKALCYLLCMTKIFRGGGEGWWMGGSSERCLKWGGGSLRDLSKNILRQGVGKGKRCS